jgi:hypothetical protein
VLTKKKKSTFFRSRDSKDLHFLVCSLVPGFPAKEEPESESRRQMDNCSWNLVTMCYSYLYQVTEEFQNIMQEHAKAMAFPFNN